MISEEIIAKRCQERNIPNCPKIEIINIRILE